ncbi:phage tail assembly chaperone [Photorhabdus temperata]|uniref:Phage protein n=1 Tax=Photorhabdus temperata subsp. temperata Meg1 TaxID=1393735 RepID=A0A081RS63_PHOTE|nr:phage tail assembly chaperone [Photorhabdus temperata]KER01516.1 protein of unknown function (DUF1789) [Photorhabdus temperata subsp. temperata Meg1]
MSQITLNPNPTFKEVVKITVPGGGEGELTFEFKHYPLSKLAEMGKQDGMTNDKFIMFIANGWGFKEHEFNQENLDTLLDNYPQAYEAIITTYYKSLGLFREKN